MVAIPEGRTERISSMNIRSYIPNGLSLSRIFLALGLLFAMPAARGPLLFIIIFTDFFDGFLARRWHVTSRLGTILDPIGDKLAALCLGYLFFMEGRVKTFELSMLFSRDIILLLFTLVLLCCGKWRQWTIHSFFCGKLATLLQGIIFLLLCYDIPVPDVTYLFMGTVAVAGFVELSYSMRSSF